MSLVETCDLGVNDSRTCEKIDTPLTQPRSPNVRSALLVKRHAIGAETPAGRRCSNLDEMLQRRKTATGDQRANLDRQIAGQLADLTRLTK